jgi:chromosome segregation ATPase
MRWRISHLKERLRALDDKKIEVEDEIAKVLSELEHFEDEIDKVLSKLEHFEEMRSDVELAKYSECASEES